MFATQTIPASERGSDVSNTKKEFLRIVLIQGMFTIAPSYTSRSTDFSAPLRFVASFVVRVYVSIVAGGSLTMYILAQNVKPCYKHGVFNPIFR